MYPLLSFKKTILPFLFLITLLTIVFLVRSVSFVDRVINIDELEWIYNLMKSYDDPTPFVGFDPHTSGPLAIYLLSGIKLFSQELSVVNLRLYGFFVFLLPAVVMLFYTFKGSQRYVSATLFCSLLCIYDKDFFAYNTEYPLILLLTIGFHLLLKERLNRLQLILFCLITLLMPFVKFQAILFSALFLGLKSIQLFYCERKLLYQLFLYYGLLLFSGVLILYFSNLLSHFYDDYIFRNLSYASSFATKGFLFSLIENFYLHVHFFATYYFIIFTLLAVLVVRYIRSKEIGSLRFSLLRLLKSESKFIVFSFLFLVVSFFTILTPKTNFTHYYELMFVPIVFLSTYLISKSSLSIFSIVLLMLLINSNLVHLLNDYCFQKFTKGTYHHSLSYNFIPSKKVEENNNSRIITSVIPSQEKVIYLGWFNSLPMYYKQRNYFTFNYRSAHTHFLSQTNNLKVFQNEGKYLMEDLSAGTNYVVDFEGVIKSLNNCQLKHYFNTRYTSVFQSSEFEIYKKN